MSTKKFLKKYTQLHSDIFVGQIVFKGKDLAFEQFFSEIERKSEVFKLVRQED
jgi:hypothetical protein